MARSSSLVLVLVLALVAVSFAQRPHHGPMRGGFRPQHPNGPGRHPQMPGEHIHNQNYNNGPQHMRELVATACASDRTTFCPDLPERLPAERFFEALCFRENLVSVSDECRALFERYQFVKNGHHARSSSSSSSGSSSGSSSDSESSSFSGNSADFPQEFLNNKNPLLQIDEQPIQIDEQQVLPSRRPGQGYHNNNNNNHYNNNNNHYNHHNGNNHHHEQRSSPDWITLDLDTTDVALLATGVAVAGGIALVLVAIAVVLAMLVLRRCCRRRSKTATTTTTTTTSAISAAQPQPAVMPQVYYLPVPMFPNDHQQQHAVHPQFASIPMQDMAQH